MLPQEATIYFVDGKLFSYRFFFLSQLWETNLQDCVNNSDSYFYLYDYTTQAFSLDLPEQDIICF